MTPDAFVGLCSGHLSAADAALLPYCKPGIDGPAEPPVTSSTFINNWVTRERALALNLARVRSAKLKRDFSIEPSAYNADAEAQAKAAAAMENPLEAELLLDKGRWDAVEAAAGLAVFDVNKIYAYLLKLRLMERFSAFKVEEGFAEYKAVYAGIMERAPGAGD
jgi:hypothetical protein